MTGPRIFAPTPGATSAEPRLNRVAFLGGGLLQNHTLHPTFRPWEWQDRVLPTEGIHGNVTPQKPSRIPITSVTVPKDMSLLIYDFAPNIFRFSGVDPLDFVPVEPERFAGQMAWDVTINGVAIGQWNFNVTPRAPSAPAPRSQGGPITEFAIAQARAAQGLGLGLLPQRPRRPGALNVPYTLIVQPNSTFMASAVIFQPIQSPIAFFQFNAAGFLVPEKAATRMVQALDPTPHT